jgi:rare lipoprotein A (peptidoglycan hydrolase)
LHPNVKGNRVEVTNPVNGLKIVAPIVDFGPSVAQVKKGIALDLTLAAQRALGGNGKTNVQYRFV